MAKHTPKPWKRGEYDQYLGYDCMTGGIRVGPVVLDASSYGQPRSWHGKSWDRERMEADADLIGAAPDLLAACRGLLAELDAVFKVLTDAQQQTFGPMVAVHTGEAVRAIAKALGTTPQEAPR